MDARGPGAARTVCRGGWTGLIFGGLAGVVISVVMALVLVVSSASGSGRAEAAVGSPVVVFLTALLITVGSIVLVSLLVAVLAVPIAVVLGAVSGMVTALLAPVAERALPWLAAPVAVGSWELLRRLGPGPLLGVDHGFIASTPAGALPVVIGAVAAVRHGRALQRWRQGWTPAPRRAPRPAAPHAGSAAGVG